MSEIVLASRAFDRWTKLSSEDKRLRAAQAVKARDPEELWALVSAYLHKEKGRVAPSTLKNYRIALEKLLLAWQDVNLLRPEADRAEHYITRLELGERDQAGDYLIPPLKPSTLYIRKAAAVHFYEALRWAGLFRGENPFEEVSFEKDKILAEDKRQAYSLVEAAKLFEAALIELKLEDDRISILTFLAAFAAGLRIDEIRTLSWEQIDLDSNRIRIVSKGEKSRLVPLADCYKQVLLYHKGSSQQYVLEHRFRGKLSPFSDTYLRKKINLLCHRAGLAKRYKAVHALRHSFGEAMHKVLPLFVQQKIMGHSDSATTSIYAAPSEEDAVNLALGLGQSDDPLEKVLLEHKDQGVNALGFVLSAGLNPSLKAYWERLSLSRA